MNMAKNMIKGALHRRGYELCQLYEEERAEIPDHSNLTYKEAQCYRAMSNMGQLSISEARLLGDLVRCSDSERPIIEIGTLFGFSTTVIALAKDARQRLITVDNYCWNPLGLSPEAHYRLTSNRLSDAVQNHRVELRRMDKAEFYRTYDGPPPALFFCDADHSYESTMADLLWARSVGASIICGDDHTASFPGVAQAVREMGGWQKLVDGLFVL